MNLEIVRRIRGNVHGSIDVTAVEDAVLEHPVMQRLRRIKQLAFLSYVFPGASHSRFEHSLGVMHLAGKAWDKLAINQRRLAQQLARYPDFANQEQEIAKIDGHGSIAPTLPLMDEVFDSPYNLQVIRLAGLLHDLGHPPFSHSGERFLPTWSTVAKDNPNMPKYLREYVESQCETFLSHGRDPSAIKVRHEIFSLLLIDKVLSETLDKYPDLKPRVAPRDVVSVIAPAIMPSADSPLLKHGVYGLLNELVSGELDIDRMDYLLRDSRECGVIYGVFDTSRILDSLCMYHDDEDKRLHVAIGYSGLAAFEDYLRARHSMYLQVYFHKTGMGAEAMMQNLAKRLGGWSFPANLDEYTLLDEGNVADVLLKAADRDIEDKESYLEFERLLRDLLFNRRIWKRVYESSNNPHDQSEQGLDIAKKVIEEASHEWELITNATSLTRFSPRRSNKKSENYIRLIKKDDRQMPRVLPIEDYTNVIQDNEKTKIDRLYITGDRDSHGKSVAQQIRGEILKKLSAR